MGMTPEGKVKKRITTMLKSYAPQVYYFMPAANGFGRAGIFDIVVCVDGHFIGIEVKSDAKKKPTALQTKNAFDAHRCGASVFLLHSGNIDVFGRFLTEITNGKTARVNGVCVWPTDSAPST